MPKAVAALQRVPIGGKMPPSPSAARAARWILGPVTLEVELVSRSDGVFELEDQKVPIWSARWARSSTWAPSAVVRHRGLTILLTSKKLPPFDLGQWRSQGIDPEELSMIGVKAAVGHRVAYGKIASAQFTVNTRGPCTSDLTRLPYKQSAPAGVSAGSAADRNGCLMLTAAPCWERRACLPFRRRPTACRQASGS